MDGKDVDARVFKHAQSGIMVWEDVVDLRPFGEVGEEAARLGSAGRGRAEANQVEAHWHLR